MPALRLEHDGCGGDLTCLHCKTEFDVVWDTEYGDPLFGEHETSCPNCDKEIYFVVSIVYTQPKPWDPKTPCVWKYHDSHGGEWETQCGTSYSADDFGCSSITVCPGCGRTTTVETREYNGD